MTIEPVHPRPPQHPMPFVPALKVRGAGTLLFLSGCTALPLYHSHPHVAEELTPPEDIREQTRRVLDNHRLVLEAAGASFANVVKLTRYLTRMEEQDAVNEVQQEYFGDHLPTSTTIQVSGLVVPGLRLEIEMIAVLPD